MRPGARQYFIEIPERDAKGKPIDAEEFKQALYKLFGWEVGSVRVLVAQIDLRVIKKDKLKITKVIHEQGH